LVPVKSFGVRISLAEDIARSQILERLAWSKCRADDVGFLSLRGRPGGMGGRFNDMQRSFWHLRRALAECHSAPRENAPGLS
jgi:hypothetical protein